MRKPLTGAILGLILGLAIAVILQQQGIWPLDRLTVFLVPALLGLIVLLLLSMGKEGGVATMVISLIILVPMAVWGALGLGEINEKGVLNGGCTVDASSSVPDTTNVTDSSKQQPFLIDPNGGLKWVATSPSIFDDYPWKIWVDIGGARITLDSEKSQDNDGGSDINGGDVPNVTAYAAERGIDVSQLRGVYKVGGDAANTCDGYGFVKLIADPLETLASKIALAVVIVIIIVIIVIMIVGRGAGGVAAVAASAGPGAPDPGAGDGIDLDPGAPGEIFTDGFESGDTSAWSSDD